MENKNDRRNEVYDAALAMLLRYTQISKHALDYGTGVDFYRVEIHFIEYIGRNPNTNAKQIAQHFNISNAAASQTISRLENKGAVQKLYDKKDKREVKISLTDLGRRAYEGHLKYHQHYRYTYLDVFDRMTDHEQLAVINFLRSYTESLENVQKGEQHNEHKNKRDKVVSVIKST